MRRRTIAVMFAVDVDAGVADAIGDTVLEDMLARRLGSAVEHALALINNDHGALGAVMPDDPEVAVQFTYDPSEEDF